MDGEFVKLAIDPPRVAREHARRGATVPPIYFGGLSDEAKECAAQIADVYLMWPDVTSEVSKVKEEMTRRAGSVGRSMRFGWRSHVIVRETESAARDAARTLLSRLDEETGRAIREKSLDSKSAGVARQAAIRESADADGYIERHLWTGVGRARSGAGVAIVGDPDQVATKIAELADAGVSSFILSGYPHLEECDLFAKYVMPRVRAHND